MDKTVFITGGLSGMGLACAIAAAREGANIAVADLPSATSDLAFKNIQKENPKAINIHCDVSDFSHVKSAVAEVVDTFGSIDIALNNSGIGGIQGKAGHISRKAWLSVINVNLNGIFYCMYNELQQMIKQKGGVIINMASIMDKLEFTNSSNYATAKHGVIALTQTAAYEYAARGIRVIAICPGIIDLPLQVREGISRHPESKWNSKDACPEKSLGKSEEIANGFIFLASEDASSITGTTLEMDGGYQLK